MRLWKSPHCGRRRLSLKKKRIDCFPADSPHETIRRSSIPPSSGGPCIGYSLPLVAFLQIEGRRVASCKTCMVGGFHEGRRSFDCSASPAVLRQAPCSPYRSTGLVWAFHGLARLHHYHVDRMSNLTTSVSAPPEIIATIHDGLSHGRPGFRREPTTVPRDAERS
jgi:hypothetical protein